MLPPSVPWVETSIVLSSMESTRARKPPSGLRGSPALRTGWSLQHRRGAPTTTIGGDGSALGSAARPDGTQAGCDVGRLRGVNSMIFAEGREPHQAAPPGPFHLDPAAGHRCDHPTTSSPPVDLPGSGMPWRTSCSVEERPTGFGVGRTGRQRPTAWSRRRPPRDRAAGDRRFGA